MSRPSATHRGFSLIEVIVVIAVLSILASMAVPLAAKVIDQSRTEATRKQMEEIHKLIVGDPALGTAGYVGDMGRLPQSPPAQPLRLLNEQLGQQIPTLQTLGVRMGWWGPYVNSGFSQGAYLNDAWGTPYAYGNPGKGQISSAGPDRDINTLADNIVYPPYPAVIDGKLVVTLYAWNGTAYAPPTCTNANDYVRFYYSNNGAQAWVSAAANGPPPYRFGFGVGEVSCGTLLVPRACTSGLHAVEATCTLSSGTVTGQAVVFVPGNNQQTKLDLYLK
jgi:general secretion pathway protein G